MDFAKDKGDISTKGSLANTFLTDGGITCPNIKDHLAIGVENYYENPAPTHNITTCSQSDVPEVSAGIPIYLFAANNAEEFTLPHGSEEQDAEEHLQSFSENISLPLAYYSHVPGNTSMISVDSNREATIENMQGNESVGTSHNNELSEEMIQSFVVGGSKLSKQPQSSSSSNQPYHMNERLLNHGENCMDIVNVMQMPNIQNDDSLQHNLLNSDKKEIVILTEEDDDHTNEISERSSHSIPDDSQSKLLHTKVPDIAADGKMSVMIFTDEMDNNVGYNCSVTTKLPSAEELLQNYPVLHLDFNVEAELADYTGTIMGREVTTQTNPLRKPKTKKKAASTELKVILTNDEDDVNMQNVQVKRRPNSGYKCPKCPLRFSDIEILNIHTKCHSTNPLSEGYSCYSCDFSHAKWLKMYNHLFTHGMEKPFKCDQCQFSCLTKGDLAAHSFVHSNKKEWQCSKCKKSFKHRRNMIAHEHTCLGLDEAGKPVKKAAVEEAVCRICDRKLSNKRNLEKHMETHSDLKPFKCTFCGHATRLKESLIMHTRLHTGEKPYKCDLCEYSTPDKSSLRRHKRRHTNEKPYCCKFCDYKSIQKHCLDTHIRRKHTGEQFVCAICHFTTYDRYGLNQHFKHHHKDILNEENPAEPCLLDVAALVVPKNTEKSSNPKRVVISVPDMPSDSIKTNDSGVVFTRPHNIAAETTNGNVAKDTTTIAITDSSQAVDNDDVEPTIEIGCVEESLLQQIQQPGDLVFLQENGNFLIKKPDGKMLIIQQVNEKVDEETAAQS